MFNIDVFKVMLMLSWMQLFALNEVLGRFSRFLYWQNSIQLMNQSVKLKFYVDVYWLQLWVLEKRTTRLLNGDGIIAATIIEHHHQ